MAPNNNIQKLSEATTTSTKPGTTTSATKTTLVQGLKNEFVQSVIQDTTSFFLENPKLNKEEHMNWTVEQISVICNLAIRVLKNESSSALLRLGSDAPNEQWAIFGDLHGQYNEMISLLKRFSKDWTMTQPENTDMKYLFLGDYVDRGDHSLEVIISLLVWKIKCPNQIYLLRGNHECISVNQRYGFKRECVSIFGMLAGIKIWQMVNEVFHYFPLAAVIQEKYFCVHGGLCEKLILLEQIEKIQLPYDLTEGSACLGNQILWSDPDISNQVENFQFNPKRGPIFGHSAVDDFFTCNIGLKKIIRAHQTAAEGYWTAFDSRVVTVFSAPDYRGHAKNWAGIMVLRHEKKDCILQFEKIESGLVEARSMVEL